MRSSPSGPLRIVLAQGVALTLLLGGVGRAGEVPAVSPGHWHRRTTLEPPAALRKNPALAESLSRGVESDLCVGPDRAARGPVAVALADDGPDCRILNSQVQGDRFSARRSCRLDNGQTQVSLMVGQFSATAIVFTSVALVNGQRLTSHSTYARLGAACQSGDISAP
jgi:hypothetical protein